ncbi:microsomal glutathione S-transferase 1-like isoform X1 [Onthophagus taurus]|uniref:microsomal glutathione S-transferase 1-like isoform X1 n=1 Tax=Onthophagus taurus TaxID=166361 RepID=UPI000C2038FF|nr:microsomal glutathione S-transferase 1-like isoform X1 [Onthophagus taurus]
MGEGGLLEIINLSNPIFKGYIFYSALLILKVLAMAILTGFQRFKNMVFVNPEDAAVFKCKPKIDANVERVRRAHLNDLENIPIFFVAGFGYMLTNPPVRTALMLFKIFTIARFLHSLVYAVVKVPQPARGLAWGTGYCITGFMAVKTLLHFL